MDWSAAWAWGGDVFFLVGGVFGVAVGAFGLGAGAAAGASLSLAGLCAGFGAVWAIGFAGVSVCLGDGPGEAGDEGVR